MNLDNLKTQKESLIVILSQIIDKIEIYNNSSLSEKNERIKLIDDLIESENQITSIISSVNDELYSLFTDLRQQRNELEKKSILSIQQSSQRQNNFRKSIYEQQKERNKEKEKAKDKQFLSIMKRKSTNVDRYVK